MHKLIEGLLFGTGFSLGMLLLCIAGYLIVSIKEGIIEYKDHRAVNAHCKSALKKGFTYGKLFFVRSIFHKLDKS